LREHRDRPNYPAQFFSLMPKKTARSCVEHRNYHPNRVTFSNPSVALADCPAPQSSFGLASYGRAYWHRASIARPLNHPPATEAGAAPFARWLHKSGSNRNQAADMSEHSTSLTSHIIMLSSKSTSHDGQALSTIASPPGGMVADSPRMGEELEHPSRFINFLFCRTEPQPEQWAITILRNGLGFHVAGGLLLRCCGRSKRIAHRFNMNLVHGLTPLATDRSFQARTSKSL